MKRVLAAVAWIVLFLGWTVALLLPVPAQVGASENYLCVWEDGETTESYASAYAALVGAGEQGILLERDGASGVIAPTEAYARLYDALESDDLARLLAADGTGLSRLEHAAVQRTYSERLWYADEWFSWTGDGVGRTQLSEHAEAETITLFSGLPSAEVLARLGTTRLIVRGDVSVTADALLGTQVAELSVSEPYAFSDGVLTLDTAGGRRIVCGVPAAKKLTLPDAAFADAGALLACTQLEEVTVPFVGSAKNAAGAAFQQEFAYLFLNGARFEVPPSLKRVTVTGGELIAFAFYACPNVEYISACGLSVEDIEPQAFLGCTSLSELHSPRADVLLSGEFTQELLPCGCTRFVRVD